VRPDLWALARHVAAIVVAFVKAAGEQSITLGQLEKKIVAKTKHVGRLRQQWGLP
jgi:hypothetical protein